MSPVPLRLSSRVGPKESRLARLRRGHGEEDAALHEAVRRARVLGSLELAGFAFTWDEIGAAASGGRAPEPALRLLAATRAVAPEAALDRRALLAWHAAVTGGPGGFRRGELPRAGSPAPAPARFVESRVALLEEWLAAPSGRALAPAQRAALVLARLLELRPFDEANGRVARQAASHAAVQAGGRPLILVGADRERLEACLQAAFRFEMEPLSALLEEASERTLDVMIQVLEGRATTTAPRDR